MSDVLFGGPCDGQSISHLGLDMIRVAVPLPVSTGLGPPAIGMTSCREALYRRVGFARRYDHPCVRGLKATSRWQLMVWVGVSPENLDADRVVAGRTPVETNLQQVDSHTGQVLFWQPGQRLWCDENGRAL